MKLKQFIIPVAGALLLGGCEADHRNDNLPDSVVYLLESDLQKALFYDIEETIDYSFRAFSSGYTVTPSELGIELSDDVLTAYNEANGNMIELIICNNDNMAEGAISALEAAGYNTGAEGATTIPVFGVDATDAAKELIAAGKMTGTVKQDAEGMAVAIASVVKAAGEGTAMADAVAATAGTNAEMYSIADGIANKLFVAYAAYTK